MKSPSQFVHALASALLILASTGLAQAQAPPTVINSVPSTITTSCPYVLGNNLSFSGTSGSIITINTSNVTLDFAGYFISGPVNAAANVTGISATERSNITIKNGTIAFCTTGVAISGNGSSTTNNVGHRVEGMRVTYCYFYGINIIVSPSALVDHCQISKIGGATSFSGDPVGVLITGAGATVQDTSIGDMSPSARGSSGPENAGISLSAGSFAVRNRIANAFVGILTVSGTKFSDNLTSNCATPFSGPGTSVTGNN